MTQVVLIEGGVVLQAWRDFPRSHPMWDLLCQSEGWPDESDVDRLFGYD